MNILALILNIVGFAICLLLAIAGTLYLAGYVKSELYPVPPKYFKEKTICYWLLSLVFFLMLFNLI